MTKVITTLEDSVLQQSGQEQAEVDGPIELFFITNGVKQVWGLLIQNANDERELVTTSITNPQGIAVGANGKIVVKQDN